MLLSSHVSAYARCFAWKICSLVACTWGTSLGEDKLKLDTLKLNFCTSLYATLSVCYFLYIHYGIWNAVTHLPFCMLCSLSNTWG